MQTSFRTNPTRTGCLLVVLLLMAGGLGLMAELLARAAGRETRAPIVIAEPIGFCSLSPEAQFILVRRTGGLTFYDLVHQRWLDLWIDSVVTSPGGIFWLSANEYFSYHTWTETYNGMNRTVTPEDGHIINVITQTITDVQTLPPATREAILQQAAARLREIERERNGTPGSIKPAPIWISPDGHYQFWDDLMQAGQITEIHPGAPSILLNRVPALARVLPCSPGWRADSQGYYFIDSGSEFPGHPNPLRLLLTHPPFPTWMWVWRAISIVSALAILIVGWRFG